MTKTRRLRAQPQLALHITMIGKMVAAPALTNIGAGAAVGVDLRLVFVPAGDGAEVSRGWRTRLIVPGERHVFMPPLTERGSVPTFEEFARSYDAVRVDGTFRDRFGRQHQMSEEASDLAGVQRLGAEAKHLFDGDVIDDAVAELRGPLDRIAKAADSLTQGRQIAHTSPLTRLRSRVRHLLGIPNVTADGFVADVWWGRKDDAATSAIRRSRGSGSVVRCSGGLSSAAAGTANDRPDKVRPVAVAGSSSPRDIGVTWKPAKSGVIPALSRNGDGPPRG